MIRCEFFHYSKSILAIALPAVPRVTDFVIINDAPYKVRAVTWDLQYTDPEGSLACITVVPHV